MGTKGRAVPRVVCCAIPIARAAGKILVITSRKRPNYWVCTCPPFFLILSFSWAGLGASELRSARSGVVITSNNFLFVCLKQYRKVVGNRQMCS